MTDFTNVDELDILEINTTEKRRQHFNHSCEGIYLPVFWGSHPVSRSPLVLAFHNGLYYAVIVSDGNSTNLFVALLFWIFLELYQRDQEVQRFLKIRRSRRSNENLFRFLTKAEMENTNFISQFICLGVCSAEAIAIRRDSHSTLYESLIFYGNLFFAEKKEHKTV